MGLKDNCDESQEMQQGPPSSGSMAGILDIQADDPIGNNTCIKYNNGQGYVNVTFKDYRDMSYAAAQALRDELKGHVDETKQFVPVGYLSNSGKDYGLNIFAILLLNLTPVLLSPRNSPDILVHLLKESGAKVLVYEEEHAANAISCAKEIPDLKIVKSVKLTSSLLQPKPLTFEPLLNLNKEGCEHECIILHSSGSTSYPKLIRLSDRYIHSMVTRLSLNSALINFKTILLICPLFHIFGLAYFIVFVYRGGASAFPSSKMSTPRQILDDTSATQATNIACLPIQLKQISEYCQGAPGTWAKLSKVGGIIFGGAPISSDICRLYVANGTALQNGYGTTETGFLASSFSSQGSPGCRRMTLMKGIKYTLVNVEGNTAQLLIHHNDLNLATGVSPPGEGYLINDHIHILRHDKTKDILEFEVLGRVDDILVHVTGEKTNPTPLEETILALPLVEKCVMFGSNRLSSCLFVELSPEAASVPVHQILQKINLHVDKANAEAPTHSRIDHDLVYILPFEPTKQLPATAKGNVSRAKAEMLFQDEIDQLYSAYETSTRTSTAPQKMDFTSISAYIGQAFAEVTKKPANDNISFFDQGMDSLLAVKFRNILNSAYPSANLNVNSIYELENTAALAKHILGEAQESKGLQFYQEQVNSFIQEYTNFPPPATHHISPGNKTNFLVTGANGSLGSFIIKDLLKRPDVGTIFCLARAKSSQESLLRIEEGFQERGIHLSSEQWQQICALPYISDDGQLGLGSETYYKIFQSVDVIYHVAWRMDFLKGLSAFRDCVESTANLLKISATSPRRPAFHFTSTVGATMPISTTPTIVEDKLSSKLKNVQYCNGYNLSKMVSEIICYKWAEEFGFALDIHRVGQVSGDTENGAWNTREHISLLIKAAQVMKMVPSTLFDSITWIPVDVAAKGMVEIHYSPNNPHRATINHIVNPKATPWEDVIAVLKELGIPCQAVASTTFLNELKSNPDYQNVDINPLASLTDFFTNILTNPPSSTKMETKSTCQQSPSISSCPCIDYVLMKKYLTHWISTGFMEELAHNP